MGRKRLFVAPKAKDLCLIANCSGTDLYPRQSAAIALMSGQPAIFVCWTKRTKSKPGPHSALGYRPPAPETTVPMDPRPVMH